ncbi:MAG: ABC transporter permease [Cyclobacteriaceae bacterium]
MKHPEIPSFAYRLFKWFCKDALFEELEGDLEETFLRNKEKYGLKKSRRIYTMEIFKLIRPSVLKRKSDSGSEYQLALLAGYTSIAVRNLKKHKLFSFINIFSLSVAMSAGLLVIGMINDLLKFDEFHENKHEIYRVLSTPYFNAQENKTRATSPLSLAEELKLAIPGIEVTQLGRRLNGLAEVNEKHIGVNGIYADEHFFKIFSFDLQKGNAGSVLKNPHSIVITEGFAEKVFGEINPIGEPLAIDGFGTFNITGIVANPPKFSHLQFDVIGSLSTVQLHVNSGILSASHNGWNDPALYYNYIFIPENREKQQVNNWLNTSTPSFFPKPEEVRYSFELQRLDKILPGPNISDSIGPKMIMLPIIILSVIAAAILFSAIFNYTNLSMARALKRAREVGIRKLNGATRKAVFLQFIVESTVLSVLSLGFGIVLFMVLKQEFITLIPRGSEVLNLELSPELILWFGLFSLITGLVAGIAPSVFFARLSSLKALRSSGSLKTLSRVNFRKVLIATQFALSIIFILAIIITHKQYRFSMNYDLGFNKENILNITLLENDPSLLKTELMKLPEVSEVSFSSYIPGIGGSWNLRLVDPRNQDSVWVNTMNIDHTYLNNLTIDLVAGRNFEPGENDNNEQSILVNEKFVKNFGLGTPQDAPGTLFNVGGNSVEIVGVVKDFHYANLEQEIYSFVFRNNSHYQFANVKLATSDLISSLEKIEKAWYTVDTRNEMQARFFDDQIEEYNSFLVNIMKLFSFIGFLAISISCLGLFGMAIYSTEIRLKEIGVRKTFGASEGALIYLLSKGFLKLVSWGVVIGTPVVYLMFDRVILNQFFYRPTISFFDLSSGIFLLLVVCLLTIITQTWSAARSNPSSILRNE